MAIEPEAIEPVPLRTTPVAPRRFEKRAASGGGDVYFADFGRAAYGTLQITLPRDPPAAGTVTVRLGEKLSADGAAIDRKPPGSVNYREVTVALRPGTRAYRVEIPGKPFHRGAASVKTPPEIGEVTPFRYAEVEGSPVPLGRGASALRQLFVHAPFDDRAARFECSDATLNAVWELCAHTIKATTAFGVYIDGERERIPYEADAYLNQLSHYALDLDPRVARATVDHLLAHPTWPTEWSLHMPMMAAADYEATGDPVLAARHWDALKRKLLTDRARPEDGLLRAGGIVDWPAGERDGYNGGRADPRQRQQVGPEINTVVNAFYYHALVRMAALARALKRGDEARDLDAKAARVRAAFNARLFDPARGVYTDGEGESHAALHASLFPLAFGLVPEEQVERVADFVVSRGMACSVYGAQYLLEGLFLAGRDADAVRLMTDRGERSWWHMIELGSTMTLEAWDARFKPNLTWNHAWGAAPANVAARYVLGVRPLEPGYGKLLVAPQPGGLRWARGTVPTAKGPVAVKVEQDARRFRLEAEVPAGTTARLALPRGRRDAGSGFRRVTLDGKTVDGPVADGVGPGRHVLEGAR